MPVTEFANLPLTHALIKENLPLPSAVFQKLKIAKSALEEASIYEFRFFQQIEDPSVPTSSANGTLLKHNMRSYLRRRTKIC